MGTEGGTRAGAGAGMGEGWKWQPASPSRLCPEARGSGSASDRLHFSAFAVLLVANGDFIFTRPTLPKNLIGGCGRNPQPIAAAGRMIEAAG